jgi:hypothetical protein
VNERSVLRVQNGQAQPTSKRSRSAPMEFAGAASSTLRASIAQPRSTTRASSSSAHKFTWHSHFEWTLVTFIACVHYRLPPSRSRGPGGAHLATAGRIAGQKPPKPARTNFFSLASLSEVWLSPVSVVSLHRRHDQLAFQGLGQALPQRLRLRHRRPSRPQGPARQHRRQVAPLRSGGRNVAPQPPQLNTTPGSLT